MPLLSVIVPIYNGAEYVEDLLASFEKQKSKDFELILVDDGSTDDTVKVLNEKIRSLSFRAQVESIPAAGVSAARNKGMELATGDYISFVDADDIIVGNYVQILEKILKKDDFDVYVFQSRRVTPKDSFAKKGKAKYRKTNGLDMLKSLAVNPTQYGVYNLFLKREFVEEHNFRFAEDFDYYEDYDFLIRVFSAGQKMKLSESELYNYVQQKGSAVSVFRLKRFEDLGLLYVLVPYLQQIQPQFAQEYSRWFLPRIWWSLLWQSCMAFNKKDWKAFCEAADFRNKLATLAVHPDKKVRISTNLFYRSPSAFRKAVLFLGRNRSQVQRTEVRPFIEYLTAADEVRKENEEENKA